jgi:lipopolysaccharide/colanic/teichoic acid biosynthesis glycosyltransferase
MNGLLQSIFPFQGPCTLRPQGLNEFVNTRAGSLPGQVSNLGKKPKDESLPPQDPWYVSWKPRLEFLLALLGLVIAAPVVLLAAVLIKLTSRGPAVYTQVRVGTDGRRFTIYKLRTMCHRAEAATGPIWAAPGDHRVNAIGKLLRATHLDELPQLINVLMGDMSLIGPRPERPEIVHQLQARVENYLDRLAVRPGITGLAQVQLPPDVDLEGVRKKLVCDLHYIEHVGFWLDARLLVCTALLFLGIPLRWSRRLLRIPQPMHKRLNQGSRIEDRVLKGREAAARFSSLDLRSSILDSRASENWSACLPFFPRPEVEDYYQVTNFEDRVERREWDKYPSRVVVAKVIIARIALKMTNRLFRPNLLRHTKTSGLPISA